ncbi:possible aldehyde dehydrogenase, N-terminal [Rhodococcus jostii RHA1]|uniref:Possible aldehyde dehydrogenase, N-terminal n=1 Tax=Rhodococcus jostii (strain RHA1) TaxID=101510 RepID=Q0S0Q6_RHOJR|nr:possible aldehyde dehydrogenase, N-terminal [Rhodococcus jostii RHA1]
MLGGTGIRGTGPATRRVAGIIARRAPELAELTHIEMGKPQADAMLEIAMALEHLAWAAKNAARVLGRRTVRPSLLTVNQAAGVEYLPLGVAGSTALTGCGNSPSLVR